MWTRPLVCVCVFVGRVLSRQNAQHDGSYKTYWPVGRASAEAVIINKGILNFSLHLIVL